MPIHKPRGTKDLYGTDLLKTQEICRIIREIFSAYGYSEIKTPIFEYPEVFEGNDEALLKANKEFFNIKSRDSDEIGYVLRPENTASIARSSVENKLINKQIDYPLRYYYEGDFFRYERPQSGRFRQFTQMGIEKINASSSEDDVENLILVKDIQERLSLDLSLKINYIGGVETKSKWNERLKKYFQEYKDLLTPISKQRIEENPMRILDDKIDSQKDFVKNAPKVREYLSEKEKTKVKEIKDLISCLGIEAEWDESLVRGIDYYTGLVYEWVDKREGITIIAGGRYDNLFERFGYSPTPSLGLAMGIERIKMIMERDGIHMWQTEPKLLYLHPKIQPTPLYRLWVQEIRQFLINNGYQDIRCCVSYELLSPERHKKLANKQSFGGRVMIIDGGDRELSTEEKNQQYMTIINTMYAI